MSLGNRGSPDRWIYFMKIYGLCISIFPYYKQGNNVLVRNSGVCFGYKWQLIKPYNSGNQNDN